MEKEITVISQATIVIGPSDLLGQYRNSLQSRFDGMAVSVSGYYESGKGKDYNGIFYDRLIDENRKDKLTIIISSEQRAALQTDCFYTLTGTLEKGAMTMESTLRLQLKVLEVTGHDKTKRKFSAADYDLFKERIDRGFQNVEKLLLKKLAKKERPDITIITGNESIVNHDFEMALGETRQMYNISFIRTNIMSASDLINAISKNETDDCSLLVFMRGGGSGLEIFDDMELCEKVLESRLPFATAIGHENDKPVLAKLSDRSFSTPSAFGTFLSELIWDLRQEHEELDDKKLSLALTRNELKAREEEIITMRTKLDQQQTKSQQYVRTLLLTIAGVVVLLVIALWLK